MLQPRVCANKAGNGSQRYANILTCISISLVKEFFGFSRAGDGVPQPAERDDGGARPLLGQLEHGRQVRGGKPPAGPAPLSVALGLCFFFFFTLVAGPRSPWALR